MTKEDERLALDDFGWFSHREVVYSKMLTKKLKEFQIEYIRGCRSLKITYQEKDGGIEVVDIYEVFRYV